jgi:hypothetical protein
MPESAAQRPPERPASPRARLLAALKTRAGIQQGFLLAEILMPPLAKRRSHARSAFSPSPTGRRQE